MRLTSLVILGLVGLVVNYSKATTVVVSEDYGFNTTNATSFIQGALNSNADTVIIDQVNVVWLVDPLRIDRNDLTLILEPGVVLRARANSYGPNDVLLRIDDRERITIWGYGATLQMPKDEYIALNDSEYRHTIHLGSTKDIRIEGLLLEDSGGDGLYVGISFQPGSIRNYCEITIVRNCHMRNNYRQGISIISVKNCLIEYCDISETKGTLPEDGIDIEPFEPDQFLENLLIRHCRIYNNYGKAIQVALWEMNDNSPDISIRIEDTYMANNHDPSNIYAYAEIALTDNQKNGIDGSVEFENCYIASSEWSAVYVSKTVESYEASFRNCVFKGVSKNPIDFNAPIFFEVTNYQETVPRFGGVDFQNCTIIYDNDQPFFDLYENLDTSPGLGNVFGSFTVVHPGSTGYQMGQNPSNVTVQVEYLTELPEHTASLAFQSLNVQEGESGFLEITRDVVLDYPMAYELSLAGEAVRGMDYALQVGFIRIDPGQSSGVLEFPIVEDQAWEGPEWITSALVDSDCYNIEGQTADILIGTLSSVSSIASPIVKVIPNPTQDFFTLEVSEPYEEARLLNVHGVLLQTIRPGDRVSMHHLPAGSYYVQVYYQDKQIIFPVIKL